MAWNSRSACVVLGNIKNTCCATSKQGYKSQGKELAMSHMYWNKQVNFHSSSRYVDTIQQDYSSSHSVGFIHKQDTPCEIPANSTKRFSSMACSQARFYYQAL